MVIIICVDAVSGEQAREVREWTPGMTAAHAAPRADAYAVNGTLVDGAHLLADGDVLSVGYAPLGSREGWGTAFRFSVLVASMAAPGPWGPVIAIGGSLLANRLFPVEGERDRRRPEWDPTGNGDAAGLPMPVVYGRAKAVPAIKDRFVTVDGDRQYLNVLYSVAGHAVDAIDTVRVNDIPATHFRDVELVADRLGSLSQTAIPWFREVYTDYASGALLASDDSTWITVATTGSYVVGVRVDIEFPRGIYYTKSDGTIGRGAVELYLQYSTDGGDTWEDFVGAKLGAGRIRDPQMAGFEVEMSESDRAIQRSYTHRFTTAQADVQVRVKRSLPSPPLLAVVSDCYLVNVALIQRPTRTSGTGLRYPGEALLGVRAIATEQISGDVSVSCQVERETVKVWSGSAWVDRDADNPAWAAYDILCNGSDGHPALATDGSAYGAAIAASRLPYATWEGFATHCANIAVACNVVWSTETTAWDAALAMARLGRGSLIMIGGEIVPVWDAAANATQLFGDGNIVAGSFESVWRPATKRANAIEVSYADAEREWEKTTIRVVADDYDADADAERPARITLAGCTSYEQAYATARYLLRQNALLTREATWECEAEAIACRPYDVVAVQSAVPRQTAGAASVPWGEGGRIVSSRRNILADPSCETALPALGGEGSDYNATITLSSTAVRTGAKSVKIEGTGAGPFRQLGAIQTSGGAAALNGIAPGYTYTTSAYVYVPAGQPLTNVAIRVTHVVAGNVAGRVIQLSASPTATGAWQRLSVTTILPADATEFCIRLLGSGDAATCYWDDLQLEVATSATAYLDGENVTLDRSIALTSGQSYTLLVRHAGDVLESHAFTAAATESTATITFPAGTWTTLPAQYAPYAIGPTDYERRLFRVKSIDRVSLTRRKISATAYDARVYDTDPLPPRTVQTVPAYAEAREIVLSEKATLRADGTYAVELVATWSADPLATWTEWSVWLRDLTAEDALWYGSYDGGTTYNIGDCVVYSGAAYVAIAEAYDALPTDTDYWTEIYPALVWEGAWSDATAYAFGDCVVADAIAWICVAEFGDTGTAPGADYAVWEPVVQTGMIQKFRVVREKRVSIPHDYIVGHRYEISVCARTITGVSQDPLAAPRAVRLVTGRSTVPGVPTSVSVAAEKQNIRISWTMPSDKDVSYVEIWRSDSSSHAAGATRARIYGTTWVDGIGTYGTTRYYWVRAVNRTGTASAWTPSDSGAGTSATTERYDADDVENLDAGALTTGTILARPVRTAESGARVEILYPAGTGLGVIDDAGNYVLKALVSGAGVGDVEIGNYSGGSGLLWDKSGGDLIILGTLKTGTSGQRVEIDQAGNTLTFYDSAGDARLVIDDAIISTGEPGIAMLAGGAIRIEGGETDIQILSTDETGYAGIRTSSSGNGAIVQYGEYSRGLGSTDVGWFLKYLRNVTTVCTLDTDGNQYLAGKIEIDGLLDADGGADIEGNVDIEGTLDSHGAARLYSTVQVDGILSALAGVVTEYRDDVSDDALSATLLNTNFGSSLANGYIGVFRHAYSSTTGLVVRINGAWYKINGTLVS